MEAVAQGAAPVQVAVPVPAAVVVADAGAVALPGVRQAEQPAHPLEEEEGAGRLPEVAPLRTQAISASKI